MSRFRKAHHVNYAVSVIATDESTYIVLRRRKPLDNKVFKREPIFVGKLLRKSTGQLTDEVRALQEWSQSTNLDDVYKELVAYPPKLLWDIGEYTLNFDGAIEQVVDDVFTTQGYDTIYERRRARLPESAASTLP